MTQSKASRAPGRPRSQSTRTAILQAAADLLECQSYRSISIERIAAEAKVGKQSIYRWWDSKADVLLEAYSERALKRSAEAGPPPSTDASLEGLLARFFALARVPAISATTRGLIAEAQLDPEFRAKFFAVFVANRRAMMRQVIVAGVASGRFRRDLEVELVLDVIYGAFWYRLLSGTPDPLDDAFARDLVRLLAPCMTQPTPARTRARKPA